MHHYQPYVTTHKNLYELRQTMGIADAKIEGNAQAYAINDNKIVLSVEIIIILLIIVVAIALWKLLQSYIKRQVANNSVQNV